MNGIKNMLSYCLNILSVIGILYVIICGLFNVELPYFGVMTTLKSFFGMSAIIAITYVIDKFIIGTQNPALIMGLKVTLNAFSVSPTKD